MFIISSPPVGSTGTTQEVELDGAYYQLTQRWNHRASTWMVDLADVDGVEVLSGLPMRAGVSMSLHLRNRSGVPGGALMAYDTSDGLGDPGFTDLGSRVFLVYLTAAEVAEAGL